MINIAIDGPAGAGKSTISKRLAKDLGYIYIDTGALYRTVAYKAISGGIDIRSQADSVVSMLGDTTVDIRYIDGVQHMFLDGGDVTDLIRTPEVSLGASAVGAIGDVRKWLLDIQRTLAANNNCIMDGRDIGTSILPNADVKIFLTASKEARAMRRYKELTEKGTEVKFEDVLSDMIKRDRDDSSRACSPLMKADDAIEVDTSELDFEQTVSAIKKILSDKVGDR